MKLRELFYVLGHKTLGYTPKTRKYAYEVHDQWFEGETIQFAQWLHPKAYRCRVSEQEVQHHRQFLRKGDVAIDIGAHSGDSTLPMALAAGASGCVLAFESNAYVFDTLEKNSQLNRERTHIVPYNLAITEENRTYEFCYKDPGFNNGGNTGQTQRFWSPDIFRQQVQGVNLYNFLQQNHPELISRIRFIKVDTEGYDLFILQSISELIDLVNPYVQVEMLPESSEQYKRAMFQYFSSRGYQMQDVLGSPEVIESVDEVLDRPYWDMHCTPPGERILLSTQHSTDPSDVVQTDDLQDWATESRDSANCELEPSLGW